VYQKFCDLLNLLETLAMLYVKKRITKAARGYTQKYLVEALAWIDVDNNMRVLIERSLTGPDTFADLGRFRSRHRREIDAFVEAYRQDRS
jgi:hypothetical protein